MCYITGMCLVGVKELLKHPPFISLPIPRHEIIDSSVPKSITELLRDSARNSPTSTKAAWALQEPLQRHLSLKNDGMQPMSSRASLLRASGCNWHIVPNPTCTTAQWLSRVTLDCATPSPSHSLNYTQLDSYQRYACLLCPRNPASGLQGLQHCCSFRASMQCRFGAPQCQRQREPFIWQAKSAIFAPKTSSLLRACNVHPAVLQAQVPVPRIQQEPHL